MTEQPKYAVIHVRCGENGEAWPIVERVPGGWQSGAHHYRDVDVLDIRPLALVEPAEAHATIEPGPGPTAIVRCAVCQTREGGEPRAVAEAWARGHDTALSRHSSSEEPA